jgi:hypothetical protein
MMTKLHNWMRRWPRWPRRGGLGMMLGLTLCCASCATGPGVTRPSVNATGNGVLTSLPPGTLIAVDPVTGDLLQKVFVNEIAPAEWTYTDEHGRPRTERVLWLKKPLKLCTPEYLLERDAREVELMRRLEGK